MRKMAVDDGMKRFRMEYERLYQALMKAHEGHRLLEARCRQLTENAIEKSGDMQLSVKLAKQDQLTSAQLKTVLWSLFVGILLNYAVINVRVSDLSVCPIVTTVSHLNSSMAGFSIDVIGTKFTATSSIMYFDLYRK